MTDNSFIEAVSCAMRAVGEKMILYENTDTVSFLIQVSVLFGP